MSWVKLDDGFAEHPKIAQVGAIGAWLQVQALCYCNRNVTQGHMRYATVMSFVTRATTWSDAAGRRWSLALTSGMTGQDVSDMDWPALMVEAGLWEVTQEGYKIHDYDQYQPTKARLIAKREHGKVRQKRYRDARRNAVTNAATNGVGDSVNDAGPVPVPLLRDAPPAKERKALSLASPPIDKPAPKKATQWPDDFTLTLARADVARQLGVDAAGEWNKFRDHALKDGKPHKDWDAAWRYWCRQAPNFERRRMS